ncbi:MAG: response regulator transcription factor [Nitrospirae bacterium]|nr:response regulator transcription factor [Nitrospirota bacterium]
MNIAIVEDDPLLRENLKLLLNGEKDISVISDWGSAEEALTAIRQQGAAAPCFDIMLVDLGLPIMSGIDLIKKVKEKKPEVELMAHTVFEDRDNVFSAIKAGASGYILKGSSPRELIEALHSLYQGGAPMSPKIARKLIMEFQDEGASEEYLLSHREKEIVKCIEDGLAYKEIAEKLSISPHTVHTHIKKIYEKLHARNRQEALTTARKKGII